MAGYQVKAEVELGDCTWMDRAVCIGVDPDIMFPTVRGGSADHRQPLILRAKAVCAPCPVRSECLEYALAYPATNDQHGVFGGLTPAERRKVRRHHAGLPPARPPGRPRKPTTDSPTDVLARVANAHRNAVDRLQTAEDTQVIYGPDE